MSRRQPGSWRRVKLDVVLAVHDRQLAEYGGPDGLRDRGMLESALARPTHFAEYGDPDLPVWPRSTLPDS